MSETRGETIKLSSEKELIIQPHNAKTLYIDTSSVAFLDVQKDENQYITSVSMEGKVIIKLGDKFFVNIGNINSLYEVIFIAVQTENKSVLLFTSTPTKTTTFLLPLLGKTKLQIRYDTYFVNSFIDENSEYISLLYRFTGTETFKDFEQTMMSEPLFVTHKEYDKYHVMYIFKIEDKFKEDVNNFKEGKYSLFSKTLRQRIQKFYGNSDLAGTMRIIKQDEELRLKMEEHLGVSILKDSELASKPDLQKEIYNI